MYFVFFELATLYNRQMNRQMPHFVIIDSLITLSGEIKYVLRLRSIFC